MSLLQAHGEASSENRDCSGHTCAPHSPNSPIVNRCAIQQEREGVVLQAARAVEIYYETYVLRADEATSTLTPTEVTASGHFASMAVPTTITFALFTALTTFALETGKFYDSPEPPACATATAILPSTAPSHSPQAVEKPTPDHYLCTRHNHPCRVALEWLFDARKWSRRGATPKSTAALRLHGPHSLFSLTSPIRGEGVPQSAS